MPSTVEPVPHVVHGTQCVNVPGVMAMGYQVAAPVARVHLGLPSPWLTLVLPIDAPLRSARVSSELASAPAQEILIGGLGVHPIYIAQHEKETGLLLRIHPLAARTLFGMPAAEFNSRLEGADLGLGGDVVAKVRDMADWKARFHILGIALRQRIRVSDSRTDLAEAWQRLAQHRGRVSIAELANHVRCSPRQLSKIFDTELGLSPKQIARLMRFESVVRTSTDCAVAGHPMSWAETAQTHGFADQSHLIRDFHEMAGASPADWARTEAATIRSGAQSALYASAA